jgi:hypothetical protein
VRPLNFTVSSHHHEPAPYDASLWRCSCISQIPFHAVSYGHGLYHRGDTAVPCRPARSTNTRGRRAGGTGRRRGGLDFCAYLLSCASRARVRRTSRKTRVAANPRSRFDSLGNLRSGRSSVHRCPRFVAAGCGACCRHSRRYIGWVPYWKCFCARQVGLALMRLTIVGGDRERLVVTRRVRRRDCAPAVSIGRFWAGGPLNLTVRSIAGHHFV